MPTHDTNGREYVKLSDLKAGDLLETDEGFDCIGPKMQVKVQKNGEQGSLYFDCNEGRHYLDGQLDDDGDHLVGLYKV